MRRDQILYITLSKEEKKILKQLADKNHIKLIDMARHLLFKGIENEKKTKSS